MAKVQKNFRLEESTAEKLKEIVNFYNDSMPEFSFKKASEADVIYLLIEKEYAALVKAGYKLPNKRGVKK